jgi:hypothetical protein
MKAMVEKVSIVDVRQRIGDLLDRVALRHDEFIERKSNPLAALVSVEGLEQMRRFARRHTVEALKRQAGARCRTRSRWIWRSKPSAGHASTPSNAKHGGSAWRMACYRIQYL